MKQSLLNMTSIYDHLNVLMNFADRDEYAMNIAFQVHGEDNYWLEPCETHNEPVLSHSGYFIDKYPFVTALSDMDNHSVSIIWGVMDHGEPYAGF